LECKREQLQISPVTTGGHQGVCKMEEIPHCLYNAGLGSGQRRLQDIVAERRLRMAGHIIRMPPGPPANHTMSCPSW